MPSRGGATSTGTATTHRRRWGATSTTSSTRPSPSTCSGSPSSIGGQQSVVADRVVAALCTLGAAFVLGLWLARTAGRWVGLGAAALVALLPMSVAGLPFRFGRYGYLDPVAELFAVTAVVLSWVWFRRYGRGGWWWALATGASVGLAAASKENGFLGVVGPVLAGLALAVRDRRAVLQRLLQTLTAVLTACLVFAMTYLGLGHPVEAFRFMRRFQHLHSELGHSVEVAGRVTQHPPWWAFLWFVQHGIGVLVSVACVAAALAAIVLRRDRLVVWCLDCTGRPAGVSHGDRAGGARLLLGHVDAAVPRAGCVGGRRAPRGTAASGVAAAYEGSSDGRSACCALRSWRLHPCTTSTGR